MTKEQLTSNVSFLTEPNQVIGLSMYVVLKIESGDVVRLADLDEPVRIELKNQFVSHLTARLINNDDVHFGDISAATNLSNAIYFYDLEEVPQGLRILKDSIQQEERQAFSFAEDDFSKIEAFIFLIGNETRKIALYKKHYPISLIKRDSFIGLIKANTRFVRMNDDVIKINNTFDFLQIGTELIVFNLGTLERFFGFHDIIKKEARARVDAIQRLNLVLDIQPLRILLEEPRYARKMLKTRRDSPVLTLPFDKIKRFAKRHPLLRGKLEYNETETRFVLSNRAVTILFLKLLDDDFLKSDLTKILYDSEVKDVLEPTQV